MKTLSREDLLDILYGGAIMGTGGGGDLKHGIEMVDDAFRKGKSFLLADFSELNRDDLIACPYSCGAVSPVDPDERTYAHMPADEDACFIQAVENMERHLGKEICAFITTELGAGNAAKALYCAAMTEKPLVDGDPAGRSVPGLQHSTFYLNDVPITPMSLANKFGESLLVTKVFDDYRAEAIVRAFAVLSQNNTAVCDHVNTVRTMERSVIKGAIRFSGMIGRAYRQALREGDDYVQAVAQAGGGILALQGQVTRNEWSTEGGYTVGTLQIAGTGSYSGSEYRIWYKNENIILWKNGSFFVTVPDLICVFDDDNRTPQLNPYAREGENVSVVVLPAPGEWTTPRGLEVFGPKSFGFDVAYRRLGG